jgi:hypothetical protein
VDSVNADTRSTVEPRIIGVMFSDALPHERRATPAPRAPDRANVRILSNTRDAHRALPTRPA